MKTFEKRLTSARGPSYAEQIQKNYPGGLAGWQKTLEDPKERSRLTPLSTKVIDKVSVGIGSFVNRLKAARKKVMSK